MEEEGEQEQLIRAMAFACLPGVDMLRIGEITSVSLAEAASKAIREPAAALKADGAAETARLLLTAE